MASSGTATVLSSLRTFAVGRNPTWTVVRIAVLVLTTFIVFKYLVVLRKIESTSMSPTLREGTVHVILRVAYSGSRPPRRGDIVGIRTSGETVMYVKRIIGLPGETVEIRQGRVFIDGQQLEEPYLGPRTRAWNWPVKGPRPRTLGPQEFFVVGDNRSMNQEQHEFGVIEGRRIVGKVIW